MIQTQGLSFFVRGRAGRPFPYRVAGYLPMTTAPSTLLTTPSMLA